MNPRAGLYRVRLEAKPPHLVSKYISSINEDLALLELEIEASEAHVVMLLRQGVINEIDARKILSALEELRKGKRSLHPSKLQEFEDIHEFVEAYVIDRAGASGKKLHTGRSRNDQVATITRMKVRDGLRKIASNTLKLIRVLLERANRESEVPMIYYTHIQHAQIGSLGHYWLAQAESFIRDIERIIDTYERSNLSPLGASAGAGTRIPINRIFTSQLLGFDGLIENSMDAVTTRDFAFEALATLANLMINISRVCQDLILWSTSEFNYILLSDKYASTSSIMPHKKNPDPLELAKARCGETIALLLHVGNILKGIPSGYSRDLQDIKRPLLQAFETVDKSVQILKGAVSTLKVNVERIGITLKTTEAYALELAEWFVLEKGLPLRDAYTMVAKMVKVLDGKRRLLQSLKSHELKNLVNKVGLKTDITEDLSKVFDPSWILRERKSLGSPNPSENRRMVKLLLKRAKHLESILNKRNQRLYDAKLKLQETLHEILTSHRSV